MNQRIKELLSEARLFCYDDGTVSLLGETYVGQPEIQRFAELIVRECIRTIQMGITRDGHNTEQYLRSVKHIKQIREHFGVEE